MAGIIITLAQQKGGAGKTTVAAHLAVAYALAGNTVAVLDVDPQGSLGEWFERRETRLGPDGTGLVFRTASGWGARREARSLARDNDAVIIDTPPKSDMELRPAIEVANLVVVPVQPTPVDLWATEPTLAIVDRYGAHSLLVMNRVVKRATITGEIGRAVGALDHPVADTQLGSRVAYAASIGFGRTVVEIAAASQAAAEVYDLAREVLSHAADPRALQLAS